jgi:hypothetical protein
VLLRVGDQRHVPADLFLNSSPVPVLQEARVKVMKEWVKQVLFRSNIGTNSSSSSGGSKPSRPIRH